jgi:hypothetical protein
MTKSRKRPRADAAGAGYHQNEMTVIARDLRKLIKYIGAALFAIFTYLQLKDFQVGSAIETISPDLLRRLVMILYYWCWIFGATFDTDIQEMAYFTEKGRNRLTLKSVALIVLFGIVFAVLLWAERDDRLFAAALTTFFLCNVAGFAYVLWFIAPIVGNSSQKYREGRNYFSLAQLELVAGFMNGWWQRARFATGIVLVAIMNAICFSDAVRTAIAGLIARLVSVDAAQLADRLPTLMFVIFVVLLEGWIWIQRGRVIVALGLLEQLSAGYRLEPRATPTEK